MPAYCNFIAIAILSVYLTGPVVNCILILAAVFCGLWSAAALSLITPLTSWLITGSPLLLPLLGGAAELPAPAFAAARVTFSLTQLITALLGVALAMVIIPSLERAEEA